MTSTLPAQATVLERFPAGHSRGSWPAQLVGGAGLTLAAVAVLLLLVVRPNLGGRTPVPGSFPHWAQLDSDGIRASMDDDTRTARIMALSTIAVAKCARLARAVDTILAATG
ncbi:Pycsar system effector family protein [Streptomyces sp. NPDC127051]|uniref:Pycsar system effector family protein n=1 Tax=Streptomyces sp. NPDC127051 TaxID=3347119 RepID=UPI003646330A